MKNIIESSDYSPNVVYLKKIGHGKGPRVKHLKAYSNASDSTEG
jgi:hypothetical protein